MWLTGIIYPISLTLVGFLAPVWIQNFNTGFNGIQNLQIPNLSSTPFDNSETEFPEFKLRLTRCSSENPANEWKSMFLFSKFTSVCFKMEQVNYKSCSEALSLTKLITF